VLHRDGQRERVYVVPAAPKNESRAFMTLGIGRPPQILRGLDTDQKLTDEALSPEVSPPELTAIKPGDSIVAVNGQPVQASDYAVFDEALQRSGGKPVHLTVQDATGQTRTVQVPPHFMEPFDSDLNFAGMVPRAAIHALMGRTTVKGKLRPGDAIVSVTSAGDVLTNPTRDQFREWVGKAGEQGRSVGITVLRDGKTISFDDIGTDARVAQGQRGLGVQLTGDEKVPVVAATLDNSPAKAVGIPIGSTIKSINDQPVASWFDVQTALSAAQPDQAIRILVEMPDGKAQKTYAMTLSDSQLTVIRQNRYEAWVILREMEGLRQTHNPIVAAWWGVTETRDFILQFYLTIQRMFQGTVSIRNMMGPVGIVTAGAHFAFKGIAWLIWFLAMISANLAVVNFLPIPVVDGGLFTFLILEKLQGKPLSHRTQSIAQVVGLALILGVFLLVTYQDIIRLIP
jgi:regulator of sigma E protease